MAGTIVVAIEDMTTASVVAVEAARVAMEKEADRLVLVHALDQHPMMGAVISMSGYCAPLIETAEEGEELLNLAAQAIRAEYAACGRQAPAIVDEVVDGNPAAAIEGAAQRHHANLIVLGARRPHAFGRLVHPDVRAHVAAHVPCPVHVAPLQEMPSQAHAH